jgi:cation diffusion facilitator family transporter
LKAKSGDAPITVYGAITSNVVIAAAKLIVATITGSSAMIAEGVHSLVDTGNQLLLLIGVHRSRRPPDAEHPFGHGMELYFWSLIVAMILFGLGGGASIYEGITHLQHPSKLEDPVAGYIVLGVAFLAEGTSWTIALRELLREDTGGRGILQAFRASKDPSVYTVVAEDSAALLGVVVAALGIWFAHHMSSPIPDAIASILIGVILVTAALFLAYESRSLLTGERADPEAIKRIRTLIEEDPAVIGVRRILTMQLGPDEMLLNLDLNFRDDLGTEQISRAIDRIEARIRTEYPAAKHIFVEAER